MMRSALRHKLLVMFALVTGVMGTNVHGEEPVGQFLDALRQRHLYDEAIEYLNLLPSNNHLSESTRQRVLYEQGLTLLESASAENDYGARKIQLSRAAERFKKFLTDFPQHELVGAAKNQLGNILVEHGRVAVALAKQAGQKESALAEARKLFDQAAGQFDAAGKELDAQLQAMPKLIDPADKETQSRKRQIASDLAQMRMYRAGVDYELANTFAPESSEAKKYLTLAAHSYSALYESYRTRAAGLLARLWEGRCYQEMGNIKQALGCYHELMDLPATPETRSIRTKSTRHALECWIRPGEKKYQEAIERGERWEKETAGSQTDADALAIRYLTALAYQAQSNSLPTKDPNRKKLAGYARQYVVPVAKHPGEYQRPAKMLLVALETSKDKKGETGQPKTFAEAFEQAKAALDQMQQAGLSAKEAQGKSDQAAVDAAELQKRESAAAAQGLLELALSLSSSKTEIDELNSARWYLCYLAWDAGKYYEAAILGEFLARHYPESAPGQQGARVALAAFVRLYAESNAADKSFEAAHVQSIADYIFKQWPEQEESDEAAMTLLSFAVSQQQPEKVSEYLAKIPASSPRRGQAELRSGQALWSAYLRGSQAPAEERPDQAKLDALKKAAQEVLAQGITRMEANADVDATSAAAVFAMAQICVETGQPDKAIQWLEHPKLGSLTLVRAANPAAAREGFATETYKMALRAYIAAHPPQLKKAEEVMDQMEKRVQGAGDTKDAENLTAIYISLGRELQQHVQALRKSGQQKELESVSKAFDVFLDRVTNRKTGSSYASLNWVGETYYGLGTGFDDGGQSVSPKAAAYFHKASSAYQKLVDLALKDPKLSAQPENLMSVRLRLADCYKRSGNFEQAINTLLDVLKQKPTLITAQVQAAEIYQARGAVDPTGYALSITGSSPGKDGRNRIWGWSHISQLTSRNPQYEDTFHRARLNMAEARYQFGLTQKDKTKRTNILEAAKQDLWSTYKRFPDLGGEKKASQYETLLKLIQKELGNQVTGLGEFKERDAASASVPVK